MGGTNGNKNNKKLQEKALSTQRTWQRYSCKQEGVEGIVLFPLPILPRNQLQSQPCSSATDMTQALRSRGKTHHLTQRNCSNEPKWSEECEGIGISFSLGLPPKLPLHSTPIALFPRAAQMGRTRQQHRELNSTVASYSPKRNRKTYPCESESTGGNPRREDLEKRVLQHCV